MNEERITQCYFNIAYDNYTKIVRMIATVIDKDKNLIKKCIKKFKANSGYDAELIGVKLALLELEDLYIKEKLEAEEEILIYGNAKRVINTANSISFSNKRTNKLMQFITFKISWYKNWKLIWKENVKKDINIILTECYRKIDLLENKQNKKPKPILIPIREMLRNKSYQLIFFDLEMNCNDDARKLNGMEIVSIGAVKLQNNLKESSIFHCYIKPTGNHILGEKCKEITGICQKSIDGAASFNEVMDRFKAWVGDINNTLFISWSDDDLRAIRRDYEINAADKDLYKAINDNYCDFQLEFSNYVAAEQRVSLVRALEFYKLKFKGNQHNAGYDAFNLALLYETYSLEMAQQHDYAVNEE